MDILQGKLGNFGILDRAKLLPLKYNFTKFRKYLYNSIDCSRTPKMTIKF